MWPHERGLYLCCLHPQTHSPHQTLKNQQTRFYTPQNTCPGFLKTVQVIVTGAV